MSFFSAAGAASFLLIMHSAGNGHEEEMDPSNPQAISRTITLEDIITPSLERLALETPTGT